MLVCLFTVSAAVPLLCLGFIHSFISLFSIYPYTGKTMDVEIVKNIKYNIVQHTVLSH